MKITIDIPKEYEKHFNDYRFKHSLELLKADAGDYSAGLYEIKLCEMLIEAFENAEPVKHSKWIPIDHTNDAFCENCGCERGSKAWNKDDFNFCQNCGARME